MDKRRKFAIESDRAFVIDFIREKLKEILSDYASIDDEEFESKWRLE